MAYLKLKVTFLASEWGSSKGGLSTVNRELAINLAKDPKVDVTFFVPRCNDEDQKTALSHNVNLVEATCRPGFDELEWLNFPPDHLQIDVVVGHGDKLGHQGQVIRKSHKCKWVQVVHTAPEQLGMYKTYSNPISNGQKKHETVVKLCEMADFVVTVGPKLSEDFRGYLRGCRKDQMVFEFTPGILTEFSEVEQVINERKKFRVLVFGRGDAKDFLLKGFDIAAKAVAQLNNCHFLFVGAPDEKEAQEIKSTFLDCGILTQNLTVRTFKSREDLKKQLCEADLVVMPSRTEGFGLTGLEALSAGLPILVSGNSGFGEALSKVLFGSSCVIKSEEAEDIKVWTKAIKDVSDKDRMMRLQESEALRTSYGKKYNWEKQSKDLIDKMISMTHACQSSTRRTALTEQMEVTTEHYPAPTKPRTNKSTKSTGKEQQARARVGEKLTQARSVCTGSRNELAQMRQTPDNEIRLRNTRVLELREKEEIGDELQKTLLEEQQATMGEDLKQARSAFNVLEVKSRNKVTQIRQTLDKEIRLRSRCEQELKEREATVNELQKTLGDEQQARTRVGEELTQARRVCDELKGRLEHEIQRKVNNTREQRRLLEKERQQKTTLEGRLEHEIQRKVNNTREQRRLLEKKSQQKTALEDRLTTLQLQMEEERQQKATLEGRLEHEIQRKVNNTREQRRLLENERQQKTALEDRLRTMQLKMEERNTYESTERELRSASFAAQEVLIEYQRHHLLDWIIQREEVALTGNLLGCGGWGNVQEGTFRCCQVAVKQIHELIISPHNRRLFEREMRIASCCHHPNLLLFIGATNDDDSPLFVTELLDTSLRHVLSQRALNHDEIVSLALDVAKGLNYLHLNKPLPIIHRDISSANVLLWRRDDCWRAKLSDFGSANFQRLCTTVNAGALIYSAPEALTFNAQQSTKVDVYSFGVLLCEMCIGELPDPEKVRTQIGQVTNGILRRLIKRCVKRDPEARPTMNDVIRELEGRTKTTGILSRVRNLLRT